MTELRIVGARVLVERAWMVIDLGVRDGVLVDPAVLAGDVPVLDGSGFLAVQGTSTCSATGALGSTWPTSPSGSGSWPRCCPASG